MDLPESEFHRLREVRAGLRQFLRWSGGEVRAVGLTPAHHELLLTIKALADGSGPSITSVAGELLLAHHSVVELVNRAEAAGHLSRGRDLDDGRVVRLALSPAGATALARLAPHHLEELRRLRLLLRRLEDGHPDGESTPYT